MMRALCRSIVNGGFDSFLCRVFVRPPPVVFREILFTELRERALEFYRGEVWPLRHVFGVLSRYVNAITDASGKSLTPLAATTWLGVDGNICCSCVGRTSHVAHLHGGKKDVDCAHSRMLAHTIFRLSRRLGTSPERFRLGMSGDVVPDGDSAPSGPACSTVSSAAEEWDAEGPMEVFRSGQSAVSVVVTGLGRCKVAAPVRCTRSVTSCCFCDSASGFSCVHATRSRCVRRGPTAGSIDAASKGIADVEGARSQLPIPMYNCPKSVRVNSLVCSYVEMGKTFVVKAPPCCPKCDTLKVRLEMQWEDGVIMCSGGYCKMRIESFWCSTAACKTRIYADGRDIGLVIWSSSTAATAVILRDIGREMTTSGSTFGACFRHWHNKYVDLRDSGSHPEMEEASTRSRQTITPLFYWAVYLMTRDPPVWAFRCSSCQDKNGRYRVVTADGIWLGYLKRLSTGLYTNPTELCTSVKEAVEAASIHPFEWVRRFVRSALKQPSKAAVVKGGQLHSALRALALLCPAALSRVQESGTGEQVLALRWLQALLSSVWDLEAACVTLCDAIVSHLKKLVTPASLIPADARAAHIVILQELAAWREHVRRGPVRQGVGAAARELRAAAGAERGAAAPGARHDAAAAVVEAPVQGAPRAAELPAGVAAGSGPGAAAPAVPAGAVAAIDGQDGGAAGGGESLAGNVPRGAGQQGGARHGAGIAPAGRSAGPNPVATEAGGIAHVPNLPPRDVGQAVGQVQALPGAGDAGGGPRGAAGRRSRDARRPARTARAHHSDRTTSEPGDPRCLRPLIKELGETLYKDVTSFCVAISIDPVVNGFKERHSASLTHISSLLSGPDGHGRLTPLLARCAAGGSGGEAFSADDEAAVELLRENRMLQAFIAAITSNIRVFDHMHESAANALLAIQATVKNYYTPRSGTDGSSLAYNKKWLDPSVSPEELRRRFRAAFPGTSEDVRDTGAFFPGLERCRAGAFASTEVPELGTCAKNYQDAHTHFSPGTFTICCACAHPKMIGFVVLDKREGPPALLNALLSYFALLPTFVVYDFGCGALRSAIGKLWLFIALVTIVSDLFHIVNHLCSDALHPRSYSGLDHANSVAHEQRNAPINLMRRSLRACGEQEYIGILQLETIAYNVMAHARSTSPYRLPETYNYRQFYFSRNACCCGCGYNPDPPLVSPPKHAPDPADLEAEAAAEWVKGDDW